MAKNKSVIVDPKEIEKKVNKNKDSQDCLIYKSQNVYLSSFLISQEYFKLGKVYIEDLAKDNKAWIEIEYDAKFKNLLDNYIEVFNRNTAVVNLNSYQQNIRFIMHLVNKRKSGIVD